MPVSFNRSAVPPVIRLEGPIDIAVAGELKEVLLEALATGVEVHVGLETATSIDVTAVQLLWAAEREAKASGVAMQLEGPVPEPLRATLREAGFEWFPLESAGEVS